MDNPTSDTKYSVVDVLSLYISYYISNIETLKIRRTFSILLLPPRSRNDQIGGATAQFECCVMSLTPHMGSWNYITTVDQTGPLCYPSCDSMLAAYFDVVNVDQIQRGINIPPVVHSRCLTKLGGHCNYSKIM